MHIDCVFVYVDVRQAKNSLHHYEHLPKRPRLIWDPTIMSDGIFCFYDVSKSEHFRALRKFLYRYEFMFQAQAVQLWIVGVRVAENGERQVSFEEGAKLAKKYEARFSEIDDGDPEFITIFCDMVRILRHPRKRWGPLMSCVT